MAPGEEDQKRPASKNHHRRHHHHHQDSGFQVLLEAQTHREREREREGPFTSSFAITPGPSPPLPASTVSSNNMATHLVAPPPASSSSSWMLHRSPFPETSSSLASFTDPLAARDFSQHRLSLLQSSSSCSIICCSKSSSKSSVRREGPSRLMKGSKRDAEVREELQSFLAAEGLPSDQVPSMKELSKRGRGDLANIVRRRGYKAIATLLASSEMVSSQDNESYVDDAVGTDGSNVVEYSTQDMNHIGKPLNGSAKGVEYDSSKFTDLSKERWSEHGSSQSTESSYETLSDEDLQRKASEFVKTGQLEEMQERHEEDEEEEDEEEEQLDTDYEDSSDEDETDAPWEEQKSVEAIAVEKAAKLRAKILPFFKEKFPAKISNQAVDSLFNISEKQKDVKEEFQALPNITMETQLEVNRIKSALLNKERELAEVSWELQETKAQLALVQAKAAAELAQAKQISVEKDMHLKTIDHVLANLKQVQVEYWGEGGRVELAGSFNGWKHFIPMQPDPTSEIPKPDGSRGPMMWMVELWLYPGIYEIKFIVDGNWLVDFRREVVSRNTLQNNVLRVD